MRWPIPLHRKMRKIYCKTNENGYNTQSIITLFYFCLATNGTWIEQKFRLSRNAYSQSCPSYGLANALLCNKTCLLFVKISYVKFAHRSIANARRYGHLTFISGCPSVPPLKKRWPVGHPRDYTMTSFQEVPALWLHSWNCKFSNPKTIRVKTHPQKILLLVINILLKIFTLP